MVKRSTQRLTGRFQLELKNSGLRVSECKERRGGLISGNKLRMGGSSGGSDNGGMYKGVCDC